MSRVRYAAAWLLCMTALAMVGCAANITRARQAVAASAALGATAADLFGAVDNSVQQGIAADLVKDRNLAKAEAARDEWRAKQAVSIKALKIYNTTVSGLGALAELQDQGGKLDLGNLLGRLAAAYSQLVDVLKAFGVSLPGGI